MKTKLSITSGAVTFGVSKETVRRALAAVGLKTGDGATFTIKQLHNALAGDVRGQRARLLKAQADRTELLNRQSRAELIPREQFIADFWQTVLLPFRMDLLALTTKFPEMAEAIESTMAKHFNPQPSPKNEEKLKAQS